MSKKKVKKLLILGWDAAEWKVIEPMIEKGLMPTLQKFLSEGVSGKIATLDPPFSPMLWTSIATGKRAYDHGIMGFIEPTPDGNALRPVLSTSRKVKAIWNILNQHGYKSNVVGWWPSHPAEPINGVMVSNFYQNFKETLTNKAWPMQEGTIHPVELASTFDKMRVHADEITMPLVKNFIPNVDKLLDKYVPIDTDPNAEESLKKRATNMITKVSHVSKNIATCASIHSAGTYLLRTSEWDFTAIYFDTIDHFSHIGMKFHPPKMDNVDEEAYEYFNEVVTAAYRYHDMMLERTLNLIDEDTTVMILSDHGFHPDHLRPKFLPKEPAAPALEHSPYGIFAIKGPGIKKGEKIYGASLLDITPTILHLYGLPVADDMEGNVLQQIFEEEVADKIDFIPTWETVEGNDGRHVVTEQNDTWASQEAMKQLIELGYVEKPDDNIAKAVEDATAEAKYYMARNYINGNKYVQAIALLEELVEKYPEVNRYAIRLANAYLHNQKYKKCKEVLDLLTSRPEFPKYKVQYLEGMLYIHTYKIRKALEILDKLKKQNTKSPNLYMHLGRANIMRCRWADAEREFKVSISLDPTSNLAYHGLGVSYLRRNMFEEAIDAFLSSIEINNNMPQAHYHLGETLFKLEYYEKAVEAFLMAIHFSPNMLRAHYWLTLCYEKLGNTAKVKEHQEFADKLKKGERVIVTGLKRSGTSLMMQLLEAAGFGVLYDDEHKADEFNPKGYYEYQPALTASKTKDWLKDADGKAVKVYAQGIAELPGRFKYKMIWLDRPMNDLVLSYNKTKGKKTATFDTVLAGQMTEQVNKSQAWIESMPNVEILIINYNDLIDDPVGEMEDVLAFLDSDKNIEDYREAINSVVQKKAVKLND